MLQLKRKELRREPEPLVFKRADPAALARFDPGTKLCVMNCGPHAADPRTEKERRFLCNECHTEWNK